MIENFDLEEASGVVLFRKSKIWFGHMLKKLLHVDIIIFTIRFGQVAS